MFVFMFEACVVVCGVEGGVVLRMGTVAGDLSLLDLTPMNIRDRVLDTRNSSEQEPTLVLDLFFYMFTLVLVNVKKGFHFEFWWVKKSTISS